MRIVFGILFFAVVGHGLEIREGLSHDFGTYPAWEDRTAEFTLINDSESDLTIKNIRKTCGCADLSNEKNILQPGESSILCITLKGNELSGPFAKNIFIETDSENNRLTRLTLTGRAIPAVNISPKAKIHLSSLQIGKEQQIEFLLTSNYPDLKPVNLPKSVTLTKTKTNTWKATISITPTDPGQFRQSFKIPFTSQILTPPPIELLLYGSVNP